VDRGLTRLGRGAGSAVDHDADGQAGQARRAGRGLKLAQMAGSRGADSSTMPGRCFNTAANAASERRSSGSTTVT
jgi:hypothetical protein